LYDTGEVTTGSVVASPVVGDPEVEADTDGVVAPADVVFE